MDIREIFQQSSEVSEDVICHDIVGLSFLSLDGKTMPVYALSEGRLDDLPAPPVPPGSRRSGSRRRPPERCRGATARTPM